MTSVSILRQLPPLFRYADVGKFTGNANVFLTRAQAKGFVEQRFFRQGQIEAVSRFKTIEEARRDA